MSVLSGGTALVPGATADIGRAVAELLAQHGADVVVHGGDPKRGAESVESISAGIFELTSTLATTVEGVALRLIRTTPRRAGSA